MAHFAMVSREQIYAAQPPLQLDENTQLFQQNMAQPDGRAAEQLTWEQEQVFKASKKPANKVKWQRLDIHDDTIANDSHGADPPTRLAPHLHQFAPSTPAPSESTHNTPSSNPEVPQHLTGPQKGHRNKNKMASRYVPPHLRKKQSNSDSPHAETANPVAETKTLKSEGVDLAEAQSAQPPISTVNTQPKAPLSPPASPAEQHAQKNEGWSFPNPTNAVWGNDDPKPKPSTGGPRKGKRHVWPKNRDMKPISDDEDDGGVECWSQSNGDPDYDVKKLVDWNGDWLPPPETWAARHAFTDRHFGAAIEKWINGQDKSCIGNLTHLLKMDEYKGVAVKGGVVLIDGKVVAQQTINYEIAPRSWIATKIEGDPPQDFWQAYADRAPRPVSNTDLSEHRPFWEEYLDATTEFLNPTRHPMSALDMTDEYNCKPAAGQSATQYLRLIHEKNQLRKRRHREKLNKKPQIQNQELIPSDPGYRPTSNVYLRPVCAADAKGIQELYNHYVMNTIHVVEYRARAIRDIVERIRNITDENLPYIVAVHKGSHPRNPQPFVNDFVVGIAYIDDFVDKGSMCRYTFELECYVHPDFVRQNIAKCLFDRLLGIVNPEYPTKGGYAWVNPSQYLQTGQSRVVKVINCHVYHQNGDDVVWVTEFMRKFRFRKAGHLFKMGYKFGKVVDVTLYQHETSEDINANVPPTWPL